jgi:hypothetical protein
MEPTQALQARPVDAGGEIRHVEFPVMVRALPWVRARRFIASDVGRRGMFLLTTDSAAVGTPLEVEIPWAGQRGIHLSVTVQACHGDAMTARGRRSSGWCVRFDELDEQDWRELNGLLDDLEQRDSLPVAKPGPAVTPQRADHESRAGSLRPSGLFTDLSEEHAAPDPGAAALDPLEFGRPGVARSPVR